MKSSIIVLISVYISFFPTSFAKCHLGANSIPNLKQCDQIPLIIGDGQTKISEKKFQICSKIKFEKPVEWILVNENGYFNTEYKFQENKMIDDRKILEKFEVDFVVSEIDGLEISQEEKHAAYERYMEDLRKQSMINTNLYVHQISDSGVLAQFNIILKKGIKLGSVSKYNATSRGEVLNDNEFSKFLSVNSSANSNLIKNLNDSANTEKRCYRKEIGSFVKIDCLYMGKSFYDYEKEPVEFDLIVLVDKDLKIVFEPGYTYSNGIHFDPHYEMVVDDIPYLVFTYTPSGEIYSRSAIGYFIDNKFYMSEIYNQCNDLDYQFRLC